MILELIREALEKHKGIKYDLINLLEKSNQPNMSKQKMREELFRIYLNIK